MADTNSQHGGSVTTEGDGIHYRGLVVFMVILAVTTLVCEGIVTGLFKYMDAKHLQTTPARAVMAAPQGTLPPPPNLLTDEPANLKTFRAAEEESLTTYGWQDKNAGVVRLPIERAKQLLLERGLPIAGAAPAAAPAGNDKKADIKK